MNWIKLLCRLDRNEFHFSTSNHNIILIKLFWLYINKRKILEQTDRLKKVTKQIKKSLLLQLRQYKRQIKVSLLAFPYWIKNGRKKFFSFNISISYRNLFAYSLITMMTTALFKVSISSKLIVNFLFQFFEMVKRLRKTTFIFCYFCLCDKIQVQFFFIFKFCNRWQNKNISVT